MIKNNKIGFTLIETLIYIVIAAALLGVISSLVLNIFNARKHLMVSNLVQENARFIFNTLNTEIHQTTSIEDVVPALETYHFYQGVTERFSLTNENGDLLYRQTEDEGSGFPAQSTAVPVMLNSEKIEVSNFTLQALDSQDGVLRQGVLVDFTLTVGQPEDTYGFATADYSTFLSLR